MKKYYMRQIFADTKADSKSGVAVQSETAQAVSGETYDKGSYCDFSANAVKAIAGKDLLLAIWDATGENLYAVAGQKTLKINRSADTIEVTTKDTADGWKSYIPGMKDWSIDIDGIYIKDDESQKALSIAFENGDPVCLKVYNQKEKKGMFGGLACITDFPIEASYDDTVTYSNSFQGMGAFVDLSRNTPSKDTIPGEE